MRRRDVEPVPRVPWDEFARRFDWRQGEHVGLVGPTGRGKTTLALAILPRRTWRVVIGTKAQDSTLNGLVKHEGYVPIAEWPPPNDRVTSVLLWPKWKSGASRKLQAKTIGTALDRILSETSWAVLADDVQYLAGFLHLGDLLDTLWLQGRSNKVSLIAATQRPRHVPLNMWTQSTHLFVWGTKHAGDLKSLGEMGGLDVDRIRATVAQLEGHDVLYVNTRTGKLAVTRAPGR